MDGKEIKLVRYTKEDLNRAFEDVHSGNLVIGMYIDDLQLQLQTAQEENKKLKELINSIENPPCHVDCEGEECPEREGCPFIVKQELKGGNKDE